jgi:tyrosinase
MQDVFTSTNDPLFFLHHAGLDRLWAMWQELDLDNRLHNVSGTVPSLLPFSFPGSNFTLDTPIWMGFSAPDRPVKDVMDTMNRNGKGFLCYKYDKDAEMYN